MLNINPIITLAMNKSTNLFRSSIMVISLIIIGKIIGFLRDIFISAYYGATISSDAYFAANIIPSVIFGALISSALVYFIPIYSDNVINKNIESANKYANNILNILLIISVILTIIGIAFADSFITLSAPGFDTEKHNLAVKLCRILVCSFAFNTISLTYSSISNYNKSYFTPQLIPIVSGTCIIIGIMVFNSSLGIFSVAISAVLATIIQVFIQYYSVRRFFNYKPYVNFKSPEMKKMILLTAPIFLGMFVDQLNLFVDSVLCSELPTGSLSALNYAQRLLFTINGIFATGIITVLYPYFADFAAKGDNANVVAYLNKTLKVISLITIPIIITVFVEGENIIKVIFFRGAFNEDALFLTSRVFVFYSMGLIFLGFREIYTRVFYVYNDSKTPFIIGLISATINIVLNFVLIKPMGVGGLALATSISCLISSLMFAICIKRKSFYRELKLTIIKEHFIIKVAVATLAMLIIRYLMSMISLEINYIIMLVINIITLFTTFFVTLILLKEKNVVMSKNILLNKIKLHV